jgi:LPLT family lysophospholipid transporter-like MFS transporter
MDKPHSEQLPAGRQKRTFNLLLVAQSLSAFGDNAVYSVIMGILLQACNNGKISLAEFGVLSAIYANCLFLPFFLLAPWLGWISDRYEKRSVLISANTMKAAGALLGYLGIISGQHCFLLSYLVIGIGAAVYSPSKYGIIPELNEEAKLVKANAAVEMTTIMSILTGFVGGGLLIDNLSPATCFMILTILYGAAAVLNQRMDRSGVCDPALVFKRAFPEFKRSMRTIITDKILYVCVCGTVILWGSAAFIKLNLQTWGQSALKLTTMTDISLLALWLSIGIIIGSFAAGRYFKTGEIRGAWRFGSLMGLCTCLMVFWYRPEAVVVIMLIIIGMLGGIYLIPLNAEIQARSDRHNIGKVISIQNCYENGAMLLSTGIFWSLNKLDVIPSVTLLMIGGLVCLVNVLWLRSLLKKS